MGGIGRPSKVSAGQRAEVLERAGRGESIRAIAAAVFGDARFRGRVERVLRAEVPLGEARARAVQAEAELAEFEGLSDVGQLRWLYERVAARLARREGGPS